MTNFDKTAFGTVLKELRSALDLTQESCAEAVGCAVATIRKLESGTRRPSRAMAERLADVLQVPVGERQAFLAVARGVPASAGSDDGVRRDVTARPAPALPSFATQFIGRCSELDDLASLLKTPQCRLLTLIGPGGIGKTRLAVEAAARSTGFADGVIFVSLAAITDPTLLAPALASALPIIIGGHLPLQDQLLNYLRVKEMLIVLDNIEQLLGPPSDARELVAAVLAAAPQVKLLVTTRERLRLQAEWVVELAGLPLPDSTAAAQSGDSDAVRLFVERARRAQHDFAPGPADLAAVARLCALVGGTPLAIELAATWVRVLSCTEILAEITRTLDFLESPARDVAARHRSFSLVFEHSWHLLTRAEQQAFRGLAVFRGGFDRDASAAVGGARLATLAALVDKSLLRQTTTAHRSTRYELHQLVRQYAAAKLAEAPAEAATVSDRHSHYYLHLVARLKPEFEGAGQSVALATMRREFENIRAAWYYALEQGDPARVALPLAAFYHYYEFAARFQEGESLFRNGFAQLERTAAAGGLNDPAWFRVRAYMDVLHGWFCHRIGQFDRARRLLQTGMATLREMDAKFELALSLYFLGVLDWLTGDYDRAEISFNEEVALFRELGDRWFFALALGHVGLVAHVRGDYHKAEQLMRQAIAIARDQGDRRMIAVGLSHLSAVIIALGDFDQAGAILRESLALSAATEERWGMMMTLDRLGLVVQAQGNLAEAIYLFREGLALSQANGEHWTAGLALCHLAEALHAQGDERAAWSSFQEALSMAQEAGIMPVTILAVTGIAGMLGEDGAVVEALELLEHVLAHPAGEQEVKERAAQLRDKLAARLPPAQVDSVHAWANCRSFEEVVAALLRQAAARATR